MSTKFLSPEAVAICTAVKSYPKLSCVIVAARKPSEGGAFITTPHNASSGGVWAPLLCCGENGQFHVSKLYLFVYLYQKVIDFPFFS